MYSIASSTADVTTLLSNSGIVIAAVVGSVLIGWVALVGVGFAKRHIQKYLTGRKF